MQARPSPRATPTTRTPAESFREELSSHGSEASIHRGNVVPEKVLDRIKDSIPLGRLGEPEEVARVVWGVNGGLDM